MTTHSATSDLPDASRGTSRPVLNYSTGAGWHSWGQARSLAAATRIVKANLPDSSRSLVDRCGVKLTVSRRTELQRELNGGPAGYVWSIGK